MGRMTGAEDVAEHARRVEKVYSALARVYDAFFDWALGPGRRVAVSQLELGEGARVLEVGVGTGLSLPLYSARWCVTGVDISDAMLTEARARLADLGRDDVDLRRMDARDLAFPDGTFDAVVAPYVMSVVPDPERVMAEMRRVCRPGGTVIVVNHFGHRFRAVRAVETALSPLTHWIGFRLDLPLETVTGTAGLRVVRERKVNLLGMWRLLVMRRED